MNVLVTGGAGYIGGIVAEELIKGGHGVTVLDSLIKGHREAVPARAAFVKGDVADRPLLDDVMGRGAFDAVLHFAAFIEAGESMVNPGPYFHNNVSGSQVLIDAAEAHGVGRFVFSSTAAVYASKDTPIGETDHLEPANVYGATKLMVEQTLQWYASVKGLRFAALRYFNACGAVPGHGERHQPETHLIPLVLQVAQGTRQRAFIFGTDYPTPDGTCIRDYVHVLDLAQAHLLALDALSRHPSLVLNLGNGSGFSVREVIEAACAVTGHPIPVEEAPRRPGDAPRLVADASLARELLGWQPRISDLKEIISTAWEWHRSRATQPA